MSTMKETPGTKTCPRCGVTKGLTQFYKRASATDGRQSICKECDLNRVRDRDDATLRVSVEVKDLVEKYAVKSGITQREAADLLLARALMEKETA